MSFTDLRTQLNQSNIKKTDPALYLVIDQLLGQVQTLDEKSSTNTTTNTTNIDKIRNLTYLTSAPENALLPFSKQLLAGFGVTFDDSVANQRTVNVVFDKTKTILNNAQIKALQSANMVLVPNFGIGKRIIPIGVDLVINIVGGGGYTNINANSYIYAALANEETGWMTPIVNDSVATLTFLTTFLTTVGKTRVWLSPTFNPSSATLAGSFGTPSILPNLNLVTALSYAVGFELIAFNSGSGDFTGGNAANVLTAETYYAVVDF